MERIGPWLPAGTDTSHREILLSTLASFGGIALVIAISRHFAGDAGAPFLVASMGASAVLLYAAPSSPMAQPWPLVGGHIISATIGVTCARYVADPMTAGALAVSLSIFAMYYLRCLHPPGGAAALVAVAGGPAIHALGYHYVLVPVALNAAVMFGAVLLLNRWMLRRHYPTVSHEPKDRGRACDALLDEQDIGSALHALDTYIDVSRDQLIEIFTLALSHAEKRCTAGIRCEDLMTTAVPPVEYGTPLEEVWSRYRRHRVPEIPVVDRAGRIIGLVGVDDFLKHAAHYPQENVLDRLRHTIRRTPGFNSEKPEVAGQVMRHPPLTARTSDKVSSLFGRFNPLETHVIPVTDDCGKLAGILTTEAILSVLHGKWPPVTGSEANATAS